MKVVAKRSLQGWAGVSHEERQGKYDSGGAKGRVRAREPAASGGQELERAGCGHGIKNRSAQRWDGWELEALHILRFIFSAIGRFLGGLNWEAAQSDLRLRWVTLTADETLTGGRQEPGGQDHLDHRRAGKSL